MPSSTSKKSRQPSSLSDGVDNTVAGSSMDPEYSVITLVANSLTKQPHSILTLLTNQMKQSFEKKSKVKHAKIMRAARDQVEKLLSTRSRMLAQAQSELASCAQEYSTGYAQDLDEIRALWMAMAQRREALMELRSSEEKMVHKLELDREKNSVAHLTEAKADCEVQGQIIASLGSLG